MITSAEMITAAAVSAEMIVHLRTIIAELADREAKLRQEIESLRKQIAEKEGL